MAHKYTFNATTFDKNRQDHFIQLIDKLAKIEPITPWEDIKIGEVYHIPNIMCYNRADFIVSEKTRNYINGMIREEGGNWKNYSLFKAETRTKFLVKKVNFYKRKA